MKIGESPNITNESLQSLYNECIRDGWALLNNTEIKEQFSRYPNVKISAFVNNEKFNAWLLKSNKLLSLLHMNTPSQINDSLHGAFSLFDLLMSLPASFPEHSWLSVDKKIMEDAEKNTY